MNSELYKQLEVDGVKFNVYVCPDESSRPPWENNDCHGPVSKWTTRSKKPGEMVLANDHGQSIYYDFQESCRIAKKRLPGIPRCDGKTKRQIAANYAMEDFKYLRGYINGYWEYVGVIVQLLDDDGDEILGDSESVWGIESNNKCYINTIASQLAQEIVHSLSVFS